MNENTIRYLIACITIVILALVIGLLGECHSAREERATCIKNGTNAAECRLLFPSMGGNNQ